MTSPTVDDLAISPEALYERVEQKKLFTLVDVRMPDLVDPNDFTEEPYFEVMHIPYVEFLDEPEKTLARLPRDREIIFICRTGNKTRMVMEEIKDEPFEKTWVEGGLAAWRNFTSRVR